MATNRSAPLGPVIPELAYPDVGAAVDWLVEVLGFVERVRIGAGHRAQLTFGEGSLIVAGVAAYFAAQGSPTPLRYLLGFLPRRSRRAADRLRQNPLG